MLKDIDFKRVTDMAMAIVPEKMEDGIIWNTFLINMGENTMQSVLVNVRGYGEIENKTIKTSQMRYFFDEVAPKSFVKVEDLLEDLLSLNNEYWVSFPETIIYLIKNTFSCRKQLRSKIWYMSL
jgi:hypothetical protein